MSLISRRSTARVSSKPLVVTASGRRRRLPLERQIARTLRDDEIKVLWRGLDQAKAAPGIVAALRTLLLLGQRPGEVAGMAVSELNQLDDPRGARWEVGTGRSNGAPRPAARSRWRRPGW